MKKYLFFCAVVVLFLTPSCEKEAIETEINAAAEAEALMTRHENPKVLSFKAHLSGDQEVPPVDTRATGQTIFQLSKDGTELYYKLIVANIENVTMAHIHLAPAGENGGVVAWLYPDNAPPQLIPGRTQGVLAEGVITTDDLVGALAEGDLEDLLEAMLEGSTYVNVHTSQFGGGEIRGQISANYLR